MSHIAHSPLLLPSGLYAILICMALIRNLPKNLIAVFQKTLMVRYRHHEEELKKERYNQPGNVQGSFSQPSTRIFYTDDSSLMPFVGGVWSTQGIAPLLVVTMLHLIASSP